MACESTRCESPIRELSLTLENAATMGLKPAKKVETFTPTPAKTLRDGTIDFDPVRKAAEDTLAAAAHVRS